MKRLLTTGLLGLALGACLAETEPEPPLTDEPEPEADAAELEGDECRGLDVADASLDAEVVPPEAGDTTITVRATNRAETARQVQVTLHAHLGETMPAVGLDAIELAAGESRAFEIDAGELGIDVDAVRFPISVKAEIEALDAGGDVDERIFARAKVGAELPDGVLASRLAAVDPDALRVDGHTAVLGGIVEGGAGLDLIPTGDPVLADGADAYPGPDAFDLSAGEDDIGTAELILRAKSYKFCFRIPVELEDSGFGEDYGTHPTNPWVARGLRVRVYSHGYKYFDGYLDGYGCTDTFYSGYSDNFSVFAYSYGKVAGNNLYVYDAGGNIDSMVIWDADPGSSGTKIYTLPEADVSNLLAVSAYTMTRFNGGLSGKTFKVNKACRPNGCCNCASGGEIWVTNDDNKFLIAHELGHRILAFWTGGYNNDCSFDLSNIFPNATVCDTSTSHSMWSAEFQSCAAMEGWAHFVAADAFNDNYESDNPGAMFRYWNNSTVNVENGPTGGATRYYESVCNLATASTLGVELDWLRQWWDYHTNDGPNDGGSAPSHGQMMNEIDEALSWNNQNTYDQLVDGIEDQSGASQRNRWTNMASWNGID